MKLIHLSLIIESSAYQRHDISFLFLPHIKCGNKKILYYEIQEIYLLSLVLCGLVACSDDNTIEIPEAPVLEKAQLALAIKSEKGAMTKAGEEATPTDADVEYAYGRGVRYGLEYGIYGER